MTVILRIEAKGDGEIAFPDKSKLLAGEYKTRTWNVAGDEKGPWAGIWQSSPGKVKVDYSGEWEFCHILEGEAILTDAQGESFQAKAGDAFVIPEGFQGTWETLTPLRKYYVIVAV